VLYLHIDKGIKEGGEAMEILFIAVIALVFIWLETSAQEEESSIVIDDYNKETTILKET